jgi:hypothetical protein
MRSALESSLADRLRSLADRCRELSQWTTIPDVTRELDDIADCLAQEADRAQKK